MKTRRHKFFLIASFLFFSIQVLAQIPTGVDVDNITDSQMETFLKEMQARGMSETEIEAAALMNGYSSDDVAKIREKINKIKTGTGSLNETDNKTTRDQLGEVAKRTDIQAKDSLDKGKKLKVFGMDIFNSKKLTFEPNLRLPTPANYRLGPDDNLKIDITGYAYQHYDVSISPEGTIKLESLTPIYLNGLTIKDAKKKIIDRLKVLFGGLRNGKLTADVTLGDVRSIQVTLLGEVKAPGTYTLSSLSSAFNALYLGGGPSEKGSFRNIKVLRDNKELTVIDLYAYLTKGLEEGNISLTDQDVIFVPFAEKKVAIEGEVKREGIYELKSNENLNDALSYAGGYSELAYSDKINITRNTAKERKLLTVDGKSPELYVVQNGDQVFISAIIDRYENKVEIIGAVFRPEAYALSDELKTVGDLIAVSDGLREDAYLERVLLVRERENLDPEIIALNLNNAEAPKTSLRRNDKLIIKSIAELRESRKVEIQGSVNEPGDFIFAEGMAVRDLIMLAGGLKEGATKKRIEIAKRLYNDESSNETVEVIIYDDSNDKQEQVVLDPFDKVFVRDLPNYEEQKLVTITGEVNYPGFYTILKREERISDLIERAGGLRRESYVEGARFYRKGDLVALDLKKALNNSEDLGNLILSEGDSLIIPKVEEVVKLSGQVLNPTIIAYQPDLRFKDYISQAGGVTDSAFVRKAYVRYPNGLTDRTRSFLGFKKYPDIQRGMEVIIPTRNKYRWSPAERIAVSSAFVSIATIMVTILRVL